MEHYSFKQAWYKNTWTFAAVSIVLVAVVACSKNEGGGQNYAQQVNPYGIMSTYGQNCANCFPTPQVLLPGVQSVATTWPSGIADATFSLDVLVPSNPMLAANPMAASMYYGPAAIQGTLTVAPGSMSMCGALPGVYTINTVLAGEMAGGTIGNLVLQATGPGIIRMQIGTAILSNPGGAIIAPGAANRAGLFIIQMTVNGAYCPYLVTH